MELKIIVLNKQSYLHVQNNKLILISLSGHMSLGINTINYFVIMMTCRLEISLQTNRQEVKMKLKIVIKYIRVKFHL